MEIHAYDSTYLEHAQRNLGDMMDYAVNTCGMEPDHYFNMFLITGVAEQFGNGNPRYVAGMNGCEMAKEVLIKSSFPIQDEEDEMYLDKSPEYWSGWALAYYQWFSGKSFEKIQKAVSMEEILFMYPTLHETDISKFVEVMEEKLRRFYTDTNLKSIRNHAGLSQSELAKLSGVNIRQIQLFEQGQRDINKTQVMNAAKIAKALGCKIEELLEI